VQELSTQSRKTESHHSYAQRVFKCHVLLAYAEAFSSKSKDRVQLPSHTTSFQALYLINMCKSSLFKVERPNPIALTHNESSNVMSRRHMQKLSLQSLKTKSDCHCAQQVFNSYTSLACARALSSKSKRSCPIPRAQRVFKSHISLARARALYLKPKDLVRLLLRTTSPQVSCLAGICGGSLLKV